MNEEDKIKVMLDYRNFCGYVEWSEEDQEYFISMGHGYEVANAVMPIPRSIEDTMKVVKDCIDGHYENMEKIKEKT